MKETGKPMHGDPAVVAANVYTLLMENDRVRVFDVRFKPGATAAMHTHPDHVVYVVTDGRYKITVPGAQSQEFALKAGQAVWMAAGPHEVQNIGASEGHNLVVELKE